MGGFACGGSTAYRLAARGYLDLVVFFVCCLVVLICYCFGWLILVACINSVGHWSLYAYLPCIVCFVAFVSFGLLLFGC